MEHDQRVCPRCGEPAGDHRFCESCRSHPDSLTGIPTRAGAHASEPIYPAAEVPREVRRFEQALAAASSGDSDRITSEASGAGVQVDPDPPAAENLTGDASARVVEIGKLSTSDDERVSDRAQPAREVARFEEVLTVTSTDGTDQIAAKSAADAMPEVQPARTDAADTSAGVNAAPVREIELPTSDDGHDSDWGRLRREVARLEQLLTIASTDGTDRSAAKTAAGAVPDVEPARDKAENPAADMNAAPVAEVEAPSSDDALTSEPSDVAAHALREAFWFEQASAFKSNDDGEGTVRQAPQAAVPEVDPDPCTADSTTSSVDPDPGEADAQPCAQPNGSRSVDHLWIGQTSLRHWIAAICLLVLIGLVAGLTGRDLRRFSGGQPS